ncbi:MAG: type IV toxin-antitoxin system AbiEi family antitoxin domain-containing protein [Coriobacteriia bacterium]|nr:type IV toxin-antitoxin system AbiEi family antitoxin domain-containing protein [Coriobacteriia bacterium]
MGKREQLDTLLKENNGYLRTADVVSLGISRTYLGEYVRQHKLERVAHGFYRSPDAWNDGMFIIQHRYPQAVFSHEAAAYLLGLAERGPIRYVVTLPAGSRATLLTSEGVRVHKVKPDLFELGLTSAITPAGHTVRTYNAERTICDLFRKRNSGDTQDLQTAAREYLRRKDKNIPLLMRYAKQFSLDRIVQNYLEAVL